MSTVFKRRIFDKLQDHAFFLGDVSPSARLPFFALGEGVLGFQACTSPEITADVEEIKQVASNYKTYYYTGASVSTITLSRGVSTFDSTLYRWMRRSLTGQDRVQRHLMLMHFSGLAVGLGEPKNATEASAFGRVVGMVRLFGKGYILWNAIPTRYKAGSDFDAASGQISIAELEIQPEYVSEFSLDPRQLTDYI